MSSQIAFNRTPSPKGSSYVVLTDPYTGKPVSPPGALGRWQDPSGNSAYVRNLPFNVAASTTAGVLVTCAPGYVIIVLGVTMMCGATATDITFNSDSTAISCLFSGAVRSFISLPLLDRGWYFATQPDEDLTITTGAGSTTGGIVHYVTVPSASVELAGGGSLIGADSQPITL